MRVKGVVRTPAGRLLLQSVRKVVQAPEVLPPQEEREDDTIVVIGRGYRGEDLERSLARFAGVREREGGSAFSGGVHERRGRVSQTAFRADDRTGSRPALLVVDFVNGFHDPEIFGGGNIPDAVIATAPLLDFARSNALPVIFTRIVYAADGSDASLWCQKVPRLRDWTEDAPASQIVDLLAPRDGEIVIRKTQASAFFGTHLAACLVAQGTDTLIVAGCTDAAVRRRSSMR